MCSELVVFLTKCTESSRTNCRSSWTFNSVMEDSCSQVDCSTKWSLITHMLVCSISDTVSFKMSSMNQKYNRRRMLRNFRMAPITWLHTTKTSSSAPRTRRRFTCSTTPSSTSSFVLTPNPNGSRSRPSSNTDRLSVWKPRRAKEPIQDKETDRLFSTSKTWPFCEKPREHLLGQI